MVLAHLHLNMALMRAVLYRRSDVTLSNFKQSAHVKPLQINPPGSRPLHLQNAAPVSVRP
jgi:hypothetical protein